MFYFYQKIDIWGILTEVFKFFSPDLSNYPFQSPPIFFSIGEALASIAILFAVYQLKKEKWFVALRVRNYISPIVISTLAAGILFSIFSSFIFIEHPVNIIQTSIFWQIIASIMVIFSIIFLLLKATNRRLFNSRNVEKFYEVVGRELSRATPDRLNLILNAILENFDSICKSASQKSDSESSKFAIIILDAILGESSLVDLITTKRLDALRYIIFTIEKYNLNEQKVRGFSRIIKNLFSDQNSYLYKHLDRSGFALSTNLYESLFGSSVILSNFNLFGWPSFDYKMQSDLSNIQVEVFIKSLSQTIEAYLKNNLIPPRHINDGLSHLSSIFGNICSKISIEESRGVDTKYILKEDWWSLHLIANFLGHDYPFISYKEELNQEVKEREKTTSIVNFNSDETINAGISATLYRAFEQLSYIKNTYDTYHIVLQLLHGMIYNYEYKEGYRQPFEKKIWEQIAENVVNRHYPAVLKTYLQFFGLCMSSDISRGQNWVNEQAEKMRCLLYVDLKPLLDADTKMADGNKMKEVLLPKSMKYENGVFVYTTGFGKGEDKIIALPPENSLSALGDIDLENQTYI